ncbi:Hypothetical protein, putative [Bodo saltans]|uniref:Uncharacterized protein n=1 Tax=Bodo saltans TaxID=75058 RepID=A0A0S4JVQ7_BODSA|nr:Hypothetical protein, putative [Bodo saltans]|eukprot:CUG93479.1 Hypothetical protein, putative [Bodo saltans]
MDDWGIVQQSSSGLASSAATAASASTATDQDAPAKPSSGKKVSFSDAAAARSSNPSTSHLSSSDSIGSNSTAGVVVERMPPLCELMYSRRSTARAFELDAYVVQPEKGIVANAHGAMTVVVAAGDTTGGKDGSSSAGKSPLAHLETNTPIRIRVVVRRSLKGRMTLELCDAAGSLKTLSQDEVLASPYLSSTATGAASWLHVSQVSHCVGILIVRGHQCVLVRSLSGEYNGMRFPYQAHDDATQSSLECAIEAACIQCDISEDNFAVHPCIAPVMYYPAPMTCVTIYVAIANYPSTSSAMAGGEEDLNDPYDWKPYEGALKSLTTKAERAAFVKLVDNIQCAASAGMYTPPLSLPVFGPSTTAAGPASIIAHESYDGMMHAPLAVTVVHTSDLQATPEVLLNAFGVSTSPHKNSDVLVLIGEEGSPSVAFITEWIASAAAAPTAEKYILLDSAHGKDSVLYFKSYAADITEAATRRGITCTLKLVEVATPQVQIAILAAIPGLNSSSEQQQQQQQVIDVPSLIVGLEGADIVLLVASSDEKQQQVVLDFIRVVISDVNPVPVLGDWQNPDEYLIDLQDDDQSHWVTGRTQMNTYSTCKMTTRATTTRQAVHLKYTYRRSLPFNPQSFANVSSSDAVRALLTEPLHSASMHLVSMSGYVWISTRFGYRGEVTLSTSNTVEIAQGDPWWCLVDEADRPSNCNPANWDKQHGDRAQQISFVIARNSTPAQREENPLDVAAAIIESALDPALCGAQEWRTWNRHADPLAPWDA